MANTGQAGSNDERSLLGQLSGAAAPATAGAQVQYNLGQDQLGQVNTDLSQSTAYNKAMEGYQSQNLDLSNAGLGISQTGLTEQGQNTAAQQGIEEQQYGLQQGTFPEQSAEAALAYQNTMMNTAGSQAIGGTANTVGGRANVATNAANYGFQQEDIARSAAQSALGQQGEEAGATYTQEQLANAQKNLDLSGKANGISGQQMLTMLNYGNTQAGEGAQQDIISLLSQQGANATGGLTNEGAAISPIGFAAGVNPLAGQG